MTLSRLSPWPSLRQGAFLALLGAAFALSVALIAQYFFGLAPCRLCHWQRYAHLLAAFLALSSLLLPRFRIWLLASAALAFLLGAGLGFYHLGLEQRWWRSTLGCTAPDFSSGSADKLALTLLETPLVRCDEVAGSFLGLSLAAWNALASLALALLTGSATIRGWLGRGR